ncbi:hypothetical protein [Bradyrhizobium macuxiense]|uniref:hypothetical protein n=1 Tax=Bradyrhizobium macuxiense TaxID=1755647 RepID=UPI0010A96253|nr:hypothetical protein [Bradyrhizobium macuxiense]
MDDQYLATAGPSQLWWSRRYISLRLINGWPPLIRLTLIADEQPKKQKGRREADLSFPKVFRSRDQYLATVGPPHL